MIVLNLGKSGKINLSLLLLIFVCSFPTFIVNEYNDFGGDSSFTEDLNLVTSLSENIEDTNSDTVQSNINNWEKTDGNKNGITDQFEEILFTTNKLNEEIRIIVQFHDKYNYSTAISLFENNGGNVKYKYNAAINGFAGSLNYDNFLNFYNQLREYNVPFLIEGDDKGSAHLYYTSRNLRLRPYVWNTLNYTGDNHSAIAILDTGIDEEHTFFDNSSTGKVVAWVDFTPGGDNASAYDDNGHGTHVAGIAAGLGASNKDGEGRTVSTNCIYLDLTDLASVDDPDDGDRFSPIISTFNVDSLGEMEIECTFNDSTPSTDYVSAYFFLEQKGVDLTYIGKGTPGDWKNNITYDITSSSQLGIYSVYALIIFNDGGDGDTKCNNANFTVEAEVHWNNNPSDYGSGNIWKGVAPNANLVGVKIFDKHGGGVYAVALSDAIMGIEWCILNREVHNITVISMSFGFDEDETGLIDAVNNAVENGIVAVASAGNSYTGGNKINSPGDAGYAITVAANTIDDQISYYSSQGGKSSSDNTIKPDITAPGGSAYVLQMFSADTNDNDAEGVNPDDFSNDLMGAQGTSMSCPVVAGAASLLIQAMGGGNSWNWVDGNKSKLVKSILLMTATETYPLKRNYDEAHSPTLDRGGKDVHEGYGRLNIDATIEAWTNNLTDFINSTIIVPTTLKASNEDPYSKHAYAGYVNIEKDKLYSFQLSVPVGRDYDLHLYNNTPNIYGEPVTIAKSTSSIVGKGESISFKATHNGKFFIVIKAIGQVLPLDEEDDDNGGGEDEMTLLEFLLSPLGLLIIGSCVAAVIIITIFGIKVARKKRDDYEFIDYEFNNNIN
ncbi:MAG: hypothetical protein EU533_06365 [Promethearchaeota archaeon]|nr:MAG: hypothetical protein EU533_06365 [Candidatus Lokiarchaeota archaeon]